MRVYAHICSQFFFFTTTMANEIPTLKTLLIGNSGVGKSSLLLRFTDDTFLPQEEVSATIGKSLPPR